ncbi:sialate O-acetylesterase, partial [Marivirga lumbricoides]
SYGEGNKGVKVRDAQRRVDLPGTGMILTSDIGNIKDIHPRNKMGAGNRFADLVLHEVYGKSTQPYAPAFQKLEVQGNKLVLHFENAEGLYVPKDRKESQFEIAGEDKKFYTADYTIKENKVILKSKKVKNPVYARFSWGDILESNLFNNANLPSSSFTTEY